MKKIDKGNCINKKWAPHIIAVMSFVGFIILGLACATTRDPFMYDVVENSNGKSISVYGYAYWGKYYDTIDLEIPETIKGIPVTVIKAEAFRDAKFYFNKVTIPSTVTTIGDYAFAWRKLTSINIPEGVTTIGTGAFGHNNLTEVIIPSSVTTIGDYAFEQNNLSSVIISEGVTSIGGSAFEKNNLTEVIIPSSVTTIGHSAFANNKLTSVTIHEGVSHIGVMAFENNKLTNITIPQSVTKIGVYAFRNNLLNADAIAYIASLSIDEKARENAQIAYEAGNDLANQKEYTSAIFFYRASLIHNPGHQEARKKMNEIWNLRISANPQIYPAPFQGTWEHVIIQKEEKTVLVPDPNSRLGGTFVRTQFRPAEGIRVEFKDKNFTMVSYKEGAMGTGRSQIDFDNVHEVKEIQHLASGTFYYSNDWGEAYSDTINIPTVIELQSGHILGFNGTIVYFNDFPMKRIK